MPRHSICAVGSRANHLFPPLRTQNIKNTSDKKEHILSSMLLKHWDSDNMNIVEFPVNVQANSIIEVGFAKMSRRVICDGKCPTGSVLRVENSRNVLEILC